MTSRFLQSIVSFFRREQTTKFMRGLKRFRKRYPVSQYPNFSYGTGTYGTPIVHVFANTDHLIIGAYCSIADDVHIFLGGNHRIDWISTYPFPAYIPEAEEITGYETSKGDIIIGNDVWLGSGCTILSGITIGNGAVVGARSVVTREVPPYAIVAGNPAHIIRWRFDEPTRKALLQLQWWHWPAEEVRSIAHLLCSDNIEKFLAYVSARQCSAAIISQ
jgi:chloramphenicol O-acetyltransferase type B